MDNAVHGSFDVNAVPYETHDDLQTRYNQDMGAHYNFVSRGGISYIFMDR